MNYLAHLFVSADDPQAMVGNLMGDFVKGRLDDSYPPGILRGLRLHRGIDSFASRNPHFLRSKHRMDPLFGHYRGVLVDLFYDHFLARQWQEFSSIPYEEFIQAGQLVLAGHTEFLPERLRAILPRMFSTEWLLSYPYPAGIGSVLERMSARVDRPNPLARGLGELLRLDRPLLEDFRLFMPELTAFARDWSPPGG